MLDIKPEFLLVLITENPTDTQMIAEIPARAEPLVFQLFL